LSRAQRRQAAAEEMKRHAKEEIREERWRHQRPRP
jgi:hypothetical protein